MSKQATSSLGKLSRLLKKVEIDLDAEQMADLLWMALHMREVQATPIPETQVEELETSIEIEISDSQPLPLPSVHPPAFNQPSQPSASAYLPDSSSQQQQDKPISGGIPFQAPAAPSLRHPRNLARALRPLMRKIPSHTKLVLDEEETATQIAEKRIWAPVLKPAPERWLDLALVVEESRSTIIWQEIITEFQKLTELQGAFRHVSTWDLKPDKDNIIRLFPKQSLSGNQQSFRSPKELLDPGGRRLILLVSDCISPLWRQGKIHQYLKLWSHAHPLAILQLLPERLWIRTALGAGFPVQLSALSPGVPNNQLIVDGLPVWEEVDTAQAVTLPVVTLEPDSLQQWSRVVAGVGSTCTAGILFELSLVTSLAQTSSTDKDELSAAELVKRFRTTASSTARRLAGLMAAVPVSLPVVYLIQESLLKESMQVHVAEVFMSGLLQPITSERSNSKQGIVQYDFVEGVRDLLLDSVPVPDVDEVLEAVSQYIARKAGLSIKNFAALLSPRVNWDKTTEQEVMPFAQIATQVLYRLGGKYAALAEQLERSSEFERKFLEIPTTSQFPSIHTFEFDVAIIRIEIELQPFKFRVARIELERARSWMTAWLRQENKLIVKYHQQQALEFIEDLGNGVQLEMVAIPEGSFVMGSPEDELDRFSDESPQHTVTIKSFFLGKYPITQAQWQAVASLPQVNRQLDPNPSDFKGANRPVERVSWFDAVEFCDRLTQKTGREYRLPSEAEWEYACRAGTTTPFHFGETISTDLANYRGTDDEIRGWSGSYGQGAKGIYRQETTDVGSFGVANAFGLYDMHANVWEWCADHWHENYEGAPTEGRAWLEENDNDNQDRVLRGGSWNYSPRSCRSACRFRFDADDRDLNIGIRVACAAARTM